MSVAPEIDQPKTISVERIEYPARGPIALSYDIVNPDSILGSVGGACSTGYRKSMSWGDLCARHDGCNMLANPLGTNVELW